MAELKLPADEKTIRALKVGDFVELTGRMITGRDAATVADRGAPRRGRASSSQTR
jgi:tartrate dehydratase beta subunit/fumarate hydratase class I family protein